MTPTDEVNGACVHVVDERHVSKQGGNRGRAAVLGSAYENARGSIQDFCDRVAARRLQECLDNSKQMIAASLP